MAFKEDLAIDIYSLHLEVANHPQLYLLYAEQAADALAIMMRLEEKVKVTRAEGKKKIDEKRAELDARIRSDPSIYGLEKITENAISNAIILNDGFKKIQEEVAKEIEEAMNQYIEAVRNRELLDSVKLAFSHRKTMIEKECELFLAGYFADPKIPKSYKEERTQEVRKGIEASLEGMERKKVEPAQGEIENRSLRRRRPGSVEGSE